MGRAHHRRARIRHGRHTSFADQAHVVALQRGGKQGARVKAALVVAFFVHLARQFHQGLCLNWRCQRHYFAYAFEVGAGRFGVFTNPVLQRRGHAQRLQGHGIFQWALLRAPKVQRRGHQIQAAVRRAHAPPSKGRPAARNMLLSRISGKPTRDVGSSLSMLCSSAIPRPSLLQLPAQS